MTYPLRPLASGCCIPRAGLGAQRAPQRAVSSCLVVLQDNCILAGPRCLLQAALCRFLPGQAAACMPQQATPLTRPCPCTHPCPALQVPALAGSQRAAQRAVCQGSGPLGGGAGDQPAAPRGLVQVRRGAAGLVRGSWSELGTTRLKDKVLVPHSQSIRKHKEWPPTLKQHPSSFRRLLRRLPCML